MKYPVQIIPTGVRLLWRWPIYAWYYEGVGKVLEGGQVDLLTAASGLTKLKAALWRRVLFYTIGRVCLWVQAAWEESKRMERAQ